MLNKIFRYLTIYSFRRTIVKVAGRSRNSFFKLFFSRSLNRKGKKVSLVGCGQFGFSTISFYLYLIKKVKLNLCYDVDTEAASFTANFWGYEKSSLIEILNLKNTEILYIASNHSTHSDYAIKAINLGIDVYIEKPISVNRIDFQSLIDSINTSKSNIYVGYNRPFSQAISDLKPYIALDEPITLSCFISGHKLNRDHWYRNQEEGTRVCGNLGHWIDLMIHLMSVRGEIPENFKISISSADKSEPDDNMVVTYTTSSSDIATICLTARTEPFEGINETINLQSGDLIAKIDDFRQLKIWNKSHKLNKRYWPKDVGHRKAIAQPFNTKKRPFKEVAISTLIMLKTKEMVESGALIADYSPLQDEIFISLNNYETNYTRP